MRYRSSRQRAFLPILALAGFALFQTTGRTQEVPRRALKDASQIGAVREADPRGEEAGLRRLARRLIHFRAIGDLENAAQVFNQLFPPEPDGNPAVAIKTATSSLSNRIDGLGAYDKGTPGSKGTSPVFISTEHERNPSADIRRLAGGDQVILSAAEQWTGDWPHYIRIRKSSDSGLTWPETLALGDGQAWTRPSLRQVADDAIGMAFVKDWDGGDGDIYFARIAEDLATDAAFPVALSRADQRSPALATDRPAYPAPYIYIVYAERDGPTGSVKFRVSQDLGTSWSRAATVGTFSAQEMADVETAIAFDPDRNALHVAYTRPQGPSTGIAAATSVDFGASWSPSVFVTPEDDQSDSSPRIAAKGGAVIVVYDHEAASAGRDIGLAFSSSSGRKWTTGGSLAASAATERFPDVRASDGTGTPRFFASYVEDNTRVLVLSCEATGPDAWTTESAYQVEDGSLALGPVVVLPMAGPDGNEAAGAIWASKITDFDVYFGSGSVPLSLAELDVTPANQNVPYTGGTTTFAVIKTGMGSVVWTAAVTSGQDWLAITSGSSGTNAGTIVAAYQGNPDPGPRIGSIRVTPTDTAIPSVTVTVTQAGNPQLSITPAGDLTSSGLVGGPFTPSNQAYTLENTGGTSISWTAGKTQAWTTLSAVSGALAAGATATVTVSINAAADALAAGTHNDTVTFTNTTNGGGNTTRAVVLTVSAPAGALSVTPVGNLNSSGPVGGPFTPSSQAYTLENTGGTSISWSAGKTQAWTTLSAASGALAAGATATVTVSINATADALAAGTYNDTVTFTNTTSGDGNTTRAVVLTVSAPAGALSVTPVGNLNSSGPVGGPFTPSSQAYTLENTGGTSISWSAGKTQAWTALSAVSGALAAGATATVTVSINAAADALAAGTYNDTVTFTNTTNGTGNTTRAVALTVSAPAGALSVTPVGNLNSSGPVGGPFMPSSQAYTLENTGGTSISWTAGRTQAWTTLSAASGTLTAGATAAVTVSINAMADTLAAGTYNDTITFTNTTNGSGNTTRAVVLTVSAPAGALSVTPVGGFASAGTVGGPFTPLSQAYTLENTGGRSISWTAGKTQAWTTLSAVSGTLTGGATATVTVSINSTANALAAGAYNDLVTFTNTTNGSGNTTRAVVLEIGAGPVLAVSPSGRSVPFSSGSTTFGVSNAGGGTLTWTASVVAGGAWLAITSGSGGTNSGTITVTFTENRTSSERVAIIRITAAGAAGSPKDVTVTQGSGSITINLTAQRLVEKAWIIQRQYGGLTVSIVNPASVPIDRFVITRKVGAGDFQILATVSGSTVQGTQFTYADMFLEPGTNYTYKVVAYDALGTAVVESLEVTI